MIAFDIVLSSCRKKQRNKVLNFIHLNLALALLIAFTVFLVGIELAVGNKVGQPTFLLKKVICFTLVQTVWYSKHRLPVQQWLCCYCTSSWPHSAGCCVRGSCSVLWWLWSTPTSLKSGGCSSFWDGVS